MKKIIRVAKMELNTLFYSPIAWFLLIIFLVQCGIQFSDGMARVIQNQELYSKRFWYNSFVTADLFEDRYRGLFTTITSKLYLYLPLITMGLISRETSSGTIKLLYSSPLKVRDIVLGKFAAMIFFSLLLIAILSIFGITAILTVESVDYGQILSGLFGLFLLLCTYAAIGLFMSCLTSHQVVAALSTFVTFALFAYIGELWQDNDTVREFTYYLSIAGRVSKMIGGLISSKDVLYFLSIIFMFLTFSYFKLRASRESKPAFVRIGRYLAVFGGVSMVIYFSSRPGFIAYLDVSANKAHTISSNGQKILAGMNKGPVEITAYINLLGENFGSGLPKARMNDVEGRWARYVRFKSDIRLNYVYYYDSTAYDPLIYKENKGKSLQQIAEQRAKIYKVGMSRFKTPAEMEKIIDLEPEGKRYVMRVSYNGRSTYLRLFRDQMIFPNEQETMAAFKRLTDDQFPVVGFLEGEMERSSKKLGDRDMGLLANEKGFRNALINQGFDVETVSSANQVPANISILVIADPLKAFSPEAMTNIRQYIDRGGNLLIGGEPGKQQLLNPVLAPLGIQLMDGTLVQPTDDFAPDLVLTDVTKTTAGLSREMFAMQQSGAKVAMNKAAGLKYQQGAFDIEPLLETNSSTAWLKRNPLMNLDAVSPDTGKTVEVKTFQTSQITEAKQSENTNNPVFSASEGDEKGTFTTAAALTRKVNGKEQRIVVTGDVDFLSNVEVLLFRNMKDTRIDNFAFSTQVFGWLSNDRYPVETLRPPNKDTKVRLTDRSLSVLKLLWIWILPGALLIFATILLLKRRNN